MTGFTPHPGTPGCVLFDVDGTLIDSYRLYLESYARALQPYLGRIPQHAEVARQRPSSERHFLIEWLGPEQGAACHTAMCEAYEELHSTFCEGVYDGVPEMLAAFRAAGVPMGVVTGKGRRAWEVTERELQLGHFAVVITEDEVSRPKPDPGGLLMAAREMSAEPAETLYIGDSASDMAAARSAGMMAGAALWPKTAPGEKDAFRGEVGSHNPDWFFDQPADLVRLLAPGAASWT
ncbi:pyrophosphatase PpaX [soil metagenome]